MWETPDVERGLLLEGKQGEINHDEDEARLGLCTSLSLFLSLCVLVVYFVLDAVVAAFETYHLERYPPDQVASEVGILESARRGVLVTGPLLLFVVGHLISNTFTRRVVMQLWTQLPVWFFAVTVLQQFLITMFMKHVAPSIELGATENSPQADFVKINLRNCRLFLVSGKYFLGPVLLGVLLQARVRAEFREFVLAYRYVVLAMLVLVIF